MAHNVKEIWKALLDEGIERRRDFCFDTALAAYLLAPTDGSYELEKLGMTYFNQEFPKAKAYLARRGFRPLADPADRRRPWAHAALTAALYGALAT